MSDNKSLLGTNIKLQLIGLDNGLENENIRSEPTGTAGLTSLVQRTEAEVYFLTANSQHK